MRCYETVDCETTIIIQSFYHNILYNDEARFELQRFFRCNSAEMSSQPDWHKDLFVFKVFLTRKESTLGPARN